MKKGIQFILILTAGLCIIMFLAQVIYSQVEYPLGDTTHDGIVNIVDALPVAQYYVGLNPILYKYRCADVDSDGYITIVDALLIARFYVGLIEDFIYS